MRSISALAILASAACATAQPGAYFETEQRPGDFILRPDTSALRERTARNATVLVEDLALPGRAPVDLELTAFRVLAPDVEFRLGTDDGDVAFEVDASRYLFMRGTVVGHPKSHVFLSLGEGGGGGRVELGAGGPSYGLERATDEGHDAFRLFEAGVVGASMPPVLCGTESQGMPDLSMPGFASHVPMIRQGELAVDADYELFSLFDSEQAAIDYLVQLYGAVSDITLRDTLTRLDLVYVHVWTTPNDPYGDNVTFPSIPFDVDYDVAQLLSGRKDASAGGVAVLCGPVSWVAYALGFFTDAETANIYSQDIFIAAHELGHCLGSPHTHDMGVDDCDIPANPPQRGTIMSYCTQTNNGGSSLGDLRFHTAAQARIDDCLDGKANFAFDCNQNGVEDAVDIAEGVSADVNGNGVPDECEDCNANGVLDPEEIAKGLSADVNENGVPDECEPDCNGNGMPDDFDILMRISEDLHGNGVPDECEPDCNANGVADYNEIQADMSLDIDRDAVLDACQDCDQDGVPDIVALDGANNAWVIVPGENVLKEYHAVTGVLMGVSEAGVLTDPRDLLITPDGRILVTSAGDDRVVEFDRTGAHVRDLVSAGGIDEPGGMLLDGKGSLLVASASGDSVKRFDVVTGQDMGDLVAPGEGGLDSPYALAFGPRGRLLVSSGSDRVLAFDATSGAFIGEFVTPADNGGLDTARAILIVPDGRVVVASQFTDELLAFDPVTGAFVGQYNNGDYNGHLEEPWGLRVGPDGHVYAGASGSGLLGGGGDALHLTDPRILKYDGANGNLYFPYIQSLDSELDAPRGFDFMPPDGDCNGNLIPDACDIADGTSEDENVNGVPDECEDLCYADFNGDGALNVLDFVAFQVAWVAQEGSADCDQNGGFDVLDFVCFQQVFVGGCG